MPIGPRLGNSVATRQNHVGLFEPKALRPKLTQLREAIGDDVAAAGQQFALANQPTVQFPDRVPIVPPLARYRGWLRQAVAGPPWRQFDLVSVGEAVNGIEQRLRPVGPEES